MTFMREPSSKYVEELACEHNVLTYLRFVGAVNTMSMTEQFWRVRTTSVFSKARKEMQESIGQCVCASFFYITLFGNIFFFSISYFVSKLRGNYPRDERRKSLRFSHKMSDPN